MADPPRSEAPSTVEEAGEVMRGAGTEQLRVRPRGGGTKLSWGQPTEVPDLEVSTERLDQILEHNEGDLTAVLQAGVPFAKAQEAFGQADQRIALDPPLGDGDTATIGGVIATGDSGPLRHRYGAGRDLILGVSVALSDGTVARSGGKVIKNVAGYDLPKLFTGSFGTLGLILEVVFRLHPRPPRTVTAVGAAGAAPALGRAAVRMGHSRLELEGLDVAWDDGEGELLARCGGTAPEAGAERAAELMGEAGLEARLVEEDDDLWERQRARQRAADGAVVRVSGLPAELERVLESAHELGASVVGRAGVGLSWVALPPAEASDLVAGVEELRRRLRPFPCVVLDAPVEVREKVDVWGEAEALELMRRVKERFDPHRVCNPGIFAGGI
ncbi:MAG TPA: FAD-binding oxidoreductase [Acidimicrobiales bacterium]|nr:FAD-binding oxidoreductase [Acidimicrobiales bacterium]